MNEKFQILNLEFYKFLIRFNNLVSEKPPQKYEYNHSTCRKTYDFF